MTHIADLAPVSYSHFSGPIRAVGWLEAPHAFPRGPVDPEFSRRLMALIEWPVERIPSMGLYWCTLCAAENRIGPDCISSQEILLVPAEHYVYESPIWIGHYVLGHSYQPPEEYCRAVLACPEPASDALRRLLTDKLPELELDPSAMLEEAVAGRAPSFLRTKKRDGPFFYQGDAQWTISPDPESGSEDNFWMARIDFRSEPMWWAKLRWRRLTKRLSSL